MPLTRYQIRNEYGLADPELYKAAERDDPEALLEGVAMAGLVGVLRQLGDLAEFAAEIFHDLHEEVMSTASRGHGLMARVHQLEADFPSIEKAFLSQTSHSPFFSAPGVDWHPNLRSQQNLITRGDLPRFVMDSYEECRGPPRLFLLDKFDVAGAGACLKRYTDPSFFKGEAISPVAATGDVQREKKTRKLKKKGARKRNGETPEIAPTSHAKLHQLLLEERFENGYSDPTRVVKLKKRQLNGYPFDSETGKSYMEKFVETPSPEHKVVHEVPVNPPRLKFRSDNTSEKAVEVHEIDTVSPVSKSQQRNEFACSPPYEPEVLLKPSIDVPKEEVFDRASEMVPEPSLGGESDENPSKLPEVMDKKKFAVGIGAEGRKEGRADGYPSDEVTSEVDNYTDALTTMESEMETDNEHRTKNDMGYLNLEKHGMESDAYEEQLELAAHLSDSQSIGNFSSATDDGNSSFKKGRSSFSYSDSLSNVVENTLSDGEGADKVPPSNETYISEFLEAPSNKLSTSVEIQKLKSVELELPNNMCIEAVKIPDAKETSCVSAKLDETPHDCTQFGCESSKADDIGTILSCSAAVFSSLPSQNGDHKLSAVHGETRAIDKLDEENVDVISDSPVDLSFVSEITHEKKGNDYSKNEMCQASNADKHCIENFDGEERSSAHSGPPAAEQLLSLALAEEMSSVTEVDDAIPSTKVDSENLAPMVDGLRTYSFSEQQSSGIPDDVPQLNLDSAEAGVTPDEITTPVDGQEIDGHCCNVEGAGREAIPVELPYHYPNYADHEVQLHSDDKITGMVQTEDVTASAASPDNAVENSIDYTSDIMCSPSELVISHESFSELRDQHQKGLEFNDAILPECLVELEIQQEVNQLEVASIDSDPIPLKSEVPDDLQDVSLAKQAQISSYICDNITTSIPAQLRNQEPESSSPQSDNLLDSCEDALTPSTCLLEPGVPLQQFSRLQVDSDHTESSHVDKMLTQSPTYKDQELCVDASQSSPGDVLNQAQMFEFSEKSAVRELDIADEAVDSSDHVLPYHGLTEVTHNNHASSASHPENLPCQPLPVEFVPESAMRDLDIAEKAVDSSDHVLPCHSLTEVTPNNHVSIASHPEDLPCQPLSAEYVPESSIQVADGVKQGTGLIDSSVPSFGLHSVAIEVNHSAESGPDNLQRQLSSSEFLLQPAGLENCSIKGAMDQLDARPPLFGVFPVATQDHLEMPPLPPLPPMQWRMGKVQNTPLGSLGESVQCVQDSHTHVLSSAADEEVRFGFSTSERGILQPENPFLSHSTVEDEKSKHNVELSDGNSVQLTSYSSLTPNMVNGLAGEGTQSLNPFQNRDRAKDDFYASGGEMIQFSCSSYSPEPAVEDATTRYDHVSMQGNLMQPMNQVVAETAVDGDTSQPVTNDFGRQGDNSCNTFPPPQSIPGEKWQNSASTSGAEIAWFSKPSTLVPFFEIAKPNGNSKMKLPRPRSPLIDAVAAHDKSTLRRVTERVRPQIEPKVDERDSLLEQIRSKSFNLKPAVVTRPSIQGPKTNLKVAAILEKANAIRQALAGSDDEDDSDSWSDS